MPASAEKNCYFLPLSCQKHTTAKKSSSSFCKLRHLYCGVKNTWVQFLNITASIILFLLVLGHRITTTNSQNLLISRIFIFNLVHLTIHTKTNTDIHTFVLSSSKIPLHCTLYFTYFLHANYQVLSHNIMKLGILFLHWNPIHPLEKVIVVSRLFNIS